VTDNNDDKDVKDLVMMEMYVATAGLGQMTSQPSYYNIREPRTTT
jgi:hypothetical protein